MYKHTSGNNPLITREKRRLRRQRERTVFAVLLIAILICAAGVVFRFVIQPGNPPAAVRVMPSDLPAPIPTQPSLPADGTVAVEPSTSPGISAATAAPPPAGDNLWQNLSGLFGSTEQALASEPSAQTAEPTATYDAASLTTRELVAIIQASMTHVSQFLSHPEEANYPNMQEELDEWLISRTNDVVTVQSYVDSVDETNTKTRISFRLQMSYQTGDLTYLEFNGKPVTGSAVPIH